ncbi:TPA: pLS20_p028 family conjugation system transmembrane protein [Enterococcus faecium]
MFWLVDQLLKFQDLLHVAAFWWDVLRAIGFGLLKGFAWVVDALSGAAKEVYGLMNFYQYQPVQDFIGKYQPVIWALATVAVAYFGWQLIITRKLDRDKLINNIIFAITLFFVLPWAMQQGAELTTAGVNLLHGKQAASVQTFKNNITDLYTVDKNGWKSTDTQNDIKEKNDLTVLDITEQVDTDGKLFEASPISEEGQKLLTKRLNKVDGKFKEANMKSFWGIGDPAYYRYSWHPWLIAFELITKGIVYAFVIFKSAKLINEIGLLYVITSGIALTDLKDGQRNKQLAMKIRDSFIVLYLMMFLINFFDIWGAFIADSSLSALVKPIAVAGGAWLVIDGPNFIEQLFGIDAGLSSVGRTVIAAAQGGAALRGVGSGIGSTAKSAVSKVTGASQKAARGVAYTGSAVKGALDGFKPSKTDVPELPNNGPGGGSSGSPGINSPNDPQSNENDPLSGSSANNPAGNDPTGNPGAGNDGIRPLGGPSGVKTSENGTTSANKSPATLKGMQTPGAPLSNKAIGEQAKANKEAFQNMGITPTRSASDISGASKARQALDGQPVMPQPPKVSGEQLPQHVQEAKAQLQRDMQPRPIDTETLGEKAVNKYADTARNVYNGPTNTRSRKVYDVSKATSKRVKDSFRD